MIIVWNFILYQFIKKQVNKKIIGYYNDEFYKEISIFVNYEVIKIQDIDKMIVVQEE